MTILENQDALAPIIGNDTSRRYENKAGAFITGIDVNSKEAIEKKEKRAQRFHFQAEESAPQRNFALDKDCIKKAILRVRLEALYISGVDDMSTQDVFGYFREYPPAHIEWIDDASCNVVWLDEDTSVRALINTSRMALPSEAVVTATEGSEDQLDHDLSGVERDSLLRNELRPAIKPFKGNKLLLRFATHDDKKEPGAARRSRYYMKYGNPNYGGMKGILSNSWCVLIHECTNIRFTHGLYMNRPLLFDLLTLCCSHAAELVNLPEEPIKEEEEDEDEEEMDADDRVVEYKERGDREAVRGGHSRTPSPASGSSSDDMDYDLELKMISTPSPKKSKKMTMYADEVDTHLKSIRIKSTVSYRQYIGKSIYCHTPKQDVVLFDLRNRLGGGAPQRKSPPPPKVTDVRQLLEEKRQRPHSPPPGRQVCSTATGEEKVLPRQALPVPPKRHPPEREPIRDVHSRLGVAKDKKTGTTISFNSTSFQKSPITSAGSSDEPVPIRRAAFSSVSTATLRPKPRRPETDEEGGTSSSEGEEQEEDSRLQQVWGAMIKRKQSSHKNMKKSRLDNLPSLQIEISRDSTNESDN
uniref:Nuclear cap-binding protein subunit 3 n=1 Tax=Neogobius melanostomus TaxID=47308 RepID=A0A8C6U2U2_9GOBI